MVIASPGVAVGRPPLPVGSHVCWIVEDAEAGAAEAASFLAEAAETGERPVVFAPAGSARSIVPAHPGALAADPAADFLHGGPLDPSAMARVLREQESLARARGYRGLRLVADMGWLHRLRPGPCAIVAYEAILDRLADELGATIICAYPRWSFTSEALVGTLAVHSVLHGHDTEPQFRFISRDAGEWRLSGEVDITVRTLFESAFAAAVRLGDCAVDLEGLRFIDVGGVRAIATAAGDETVELRNVPRVLRRYWELCGFTSAAPGVQLSLSDW